MSIRFNKITIIGVGLMGGSLGLALRQHQVAREIIGLGRNSQRLEKALKLGAIDRATTDYKDALTDADVVVICTPVGDIVSQFQTILPFLKPGCIVTDAGSTKTTIVCEIDRLLKESKSPVHFIGSHPMCGSEHSGVEAAKVDLYQNALCILTPGTNEAQEATAAIKSLWESVGCRTMIMVPQSHDVAVACVSHLPHVMAASLIITMMEMDNSQDVYPKIASSGFRDTTRVAGGHPELWKDICIENKDAIIDVIHKMKANLNEFETAIQQGNSETLYRLFDTARTYREKITIINTHFKNKKDSEVCG
jgi:prephenate dehydrogenase